MRLARPVPGSTGGRKTHSGRMGTTAAPGFFSFETVGRRAAQAVKIISFSSRYGLRLALGSDRRSLGSPVNNRDKRPSARIATLHCVTVVTRDSQESKPKSCPLLLMI